MGIRKFAYVMLTLSFVSIISGSLSIFFTSLKDDREKTLKRIEKVGDEFEVFSANTSMFENYRDELYAQILESTVCEDLVFNDDMVKNKLSNYENLVDELKKGATKMDKLCDDAYYPDSATNKKCLNYKDIYEQVVNYFVGDVEIYNKNVDTCNSVIPDENKLASYNTSKEYIDYNKDGKFEGKTDSEK